jgi:hypothetical protein
MVAIIKARARRTGTCSRPVGRERAKFAKRHKLGDASEDSLRKKTQARAFAAGVVIAEIETSQRSAREARPRPIDSRSAASIRESRGHYFSLLLAMLHAILSPTLSLKGLSCRIVSRLADLQALAG